MILKRLSQIFAAIAIFVVGQINCAQAETSLVVAKVNKRVITSLDLRDRYNFIISESKIKINSAEERSLLINQIIDKMVDEELIRQEGEKLHITLSPEEVEDVMKSIAQRQKKSLATLKQSFASRRISFSAYQDQVRADLIWSQIISGSVKSRIKIADSQIKEFLEQQKLNTDITKFLIAEIFIPSDKEAKLLAEKLVAELRRGANFKTIVKQFSRSPTADNDGEFGWVSSGDVDSKVYNGIIGLEKNEYSEPIFLVEGYYIFKLLDKKSVTELRENDAAEARKKIFMRELDIEAKSYLIDLRKGAFVEVNRAHLAKW